MMTKPRDHIQRPIGGFTWGALLIVGLALLVLHNSAWASVPVTVAAILFVVLAIWSAVLSALKRHST